MIDLGTATKPGYQQGEHIYELIDYLIELLIDWLIDWLIWELLQSLEKFYILIKYLIYLFIDGLIDLGAATKPGYPQGEKSAEVFSVNPLFTLPVCSSNQRSQVSLLTVVYISTMKTMFDFNFYLYQALKSMDTLYNMQTKRSYQLTASLCLLAIVIKKNLLKIKI